MAALFAESFGNNLELFPENHSFHALSPSILPRLAGAPLQALQRLVRFTQGARFHRSANRSPWRQRETGLAVGTREVGHRTGTALAPEDVGWKRRNFAREAWSLTSVSSDNSWMISD
jgi:hypothetical protein